MLCDLPEDIVMKILLILPIQQLLRCRCVCKTWSALIKSSAFVDMHLALQLATGDELTVVERDEFSLDHFFDKHLIISCHKLDSVPQKEKRKRKLDSDSLTFSKAYPDIHIQASEDFPTITSHCNGIICVSCSTIDRLINPALREVKTLPKNPFRRRDALTCANGLGFDDINRDYKVVSLYRSPGDDKSSVSPYLEAAIYNLRTNSWRKLNAMPRKKILNYPSIFFKGFVHWNVDRHLQLEDQTMLQMRRKSVLTFNMTTELFDEMQIPQSLEHLHHGVFVLHNSAIACISSTPYQPYQVPNHVISVWVMKEYGVTDSWTRQYVISEPTVFNASPLWKNDKFLFTTKDRKLGCYDLATRQVRIIDHRYRQNLFASICIESLVSVNQILEEPGLVAPSGIKS